MPNVTFFSLQVGPRAGDLAQLGGPDHVHDVSGDLHEWADTAAAISQLDLVIGVDTGVVHLAGALGKPVWVLRCYAADWRWMLDRDDSPWYPTARLFRQSEPQAWAPATEQVAAALRALAESP